MDPRQLTFLKEILGPEGAEILRKAAARDRRVAAALVPRAILGWVGLAARSEGGYDGDLPGGGARLQLRKSELGWKGSVLAGGEPWAFQGAGLAEISAGIAWALGAESGPDLAIRAPSAKRLGKTVDALIKARVVAAALRKAALEKRLLDPALGYRISHQHQDLGGGKALTQVSAHAPDGSKVGAATFSHEPGGLRLGTVVVDENHQRRGLADAMWRHAEAHTGKKVTSSTQQTDEGAALWQAKAPAAAQPAAKAELPGQTAKPREQQGPQAPQAPQAQAAGPRTAGPKAGQAKELGVAPPKAAGTKAQKPKSLAVSKSAASRPCPDCGVRHVVAGALVGCLCHRELLKSARRRKTAMGWEIELDPEDWDFDAVQALLASMGA